jgi:hypothetical protein
MVLEKFQLRRFVILLFTLLYLIWCCGFLVQDARAQATPTATPTAAPTAAPTEHATYLSSTLSFTIIPGVFQGPYVVQDGEDVNFDVVSTPCAAGNMLYIYLEVLQGDADLFVGSQSSMQVGSDYLEVDCTSGSTTGSVQGSRDQTYFATVYSVASVFELYAVITTTFPARSPFDSLEVVNPLSVNGSTANVNILPGAYSFFRFTFDASDQTAGLYIKTADIADEFFSMELAIAFQDRLPRMCDSAVAAGSSVSGGSEFSHSVDAYVHLFTFKNETVHYCADPTNCTIALALLNKGVQPVDVEVSLHNFLIVPGVAYGPYTRNEVGKNAYVLKNFCATNKYAHVYIELVSGRADVTVGGVAHSAFSSQYIVVNSMDCIGGQDDLVIYVKVANTFGDFAAVYKLEVLMSTSGDAVSSPFQSSENVVILTPDTVSSVIYTDYALLYLQWEFTGPAVLLVVNNGPTQDDGVMNFPIYSCLGVGVINRPTAYSTVRNLNSCSDGGADVAVTEVDRNGGSYSLMWNITNAQVGASCGSSASGCTIYVAAIAFLTTDDGAAACNDCGLNFLLSTQHLSDYASVISPNPIASPTASPTTPTMKPTHKPSTTPTARPTHHPTTTPTAPTRPPSAVPTEVPTLTPTASLTESPTVPPTSTPSTNPTVAPTVSPTAVPTCVPSMNPTALPSADPTFSPSAAPTVSPSAAPSASPSAIPTIAPSAGPTVDPTTEPTAGPSNDPTVSPSAGPTVAPTTYPTVAPTVRPTVAPTSDPTATPSAGPTVTPSSNPTVTPTTNPTTSPSAD